MKMKKMFAAVFGLILALSMSMTAFAGTWRMDGGMWWYENDDGSYPANGFYFIRGEEYYFDVNGYMASSRHDDQHLDPGRLLCGRRRKV